MFTKQKKSLFALKLCRNLTKLHLYPTGQNLRIMRFSGFSEPMAQHFTYRYNCKTFIQRYGAKSFAAYMGG
jgi:hypothetical protein